MTRIVGLALLCTLLLSWHSSTCANAAILSPETQAIMTEIANDWHFDSWLQEMAQDSVFGQKNNFDLSGVKVSEDGQVTHIQLRARQLRGPIPSGLARLTSLVSIDIRDNIITGTIPSFLASLPHLKSLLLSGNPIKGVLPSHDGAFPSLEDIDVVDTQVQLCPAPSWVSALSSCCTPPSLDDEACEIAYDACSMNCASGQTLHDARRDAFAGPDSPAVPSVPAPVDPAPVKSAPTPFTQASIAGIVVAGVVGALIIGLIIFFVIVESRPKKKDEETAAEMPRRFGRENDSTTGTMDSRREVSKQERPPPESSSSSSSSSSEDSLVPSSEEEPPAPPPPKPVRKKKRRAKKAAPAPAEAVEEDE